MYRGDRGRWSLEEALDFVDGYLAPVLHHDRPAAVPPLLFLFAASTRATPSSLDPPYELEHVLSPPPEPSAPQPPLAPTAHHQ